MADDGMRIIDEEKLSAAHLLAGPYHGQLNQSYPNSAYAGHPAMGFMRSQSSQGRAGLMSTGGSRRGIAGVVPTKNYKDTLPTAQGSTGALLTKMRSNTAAGLDNPYRNDGLSNE